MCGLAGLADPNLTESELRDLAGRMADSLRHRGPDDSGVWLDAGAGLALAHRRLSIIDLSPAGHQPMKSPDGRWVLTYNGELYNFGALRTELVGHGYTFRGGSDTEVFLAAIAHWGIPGALARANGMFALAAWDARDRLLYLARDRMGEKPLYYGRANGRLVFASELKAIVALPGPSLPIDASAADLFLRYSYIPSPYSIYEGIRKLPAACYLAISLGELPSGALPAPRPYWSVAEVADQGTRQPLTDDVPSAADVLHDTLRRAVADRLMADVPLGALLSGGIDSSLVVALMAEASPRSPRTFSIGFGEQEFNEAGHAAAVAAHLGTDHTEVYVTPKECLEVVPDLPGMYDEPFADSSQIPTAVVCRLARQHVTVALSGDGGDELFWGYDRYSFMSRYGRRVTALPPAVRRVLARSLRSATTDRLLRTDQRVARGLLPRALRGPGGSRRVHQLAELMAATSRDDLYRLMMSHHHRPDELMPGITEPPTLLSDLSWCPASIHGPARPPLADQLTYLPDDILTKIDRASMATSLEVRVPLLDPAVIELAWRLPASLKHRDGTGKWLLRQILYRYVPPALVDRPKQGFGVPIGEWLRGPLSSWAAELLSHGSVARHGLLDPDAVGVLWQDHLAGRRHQQFAVWNVVMLQAWLEQRSPRKRDVITAPGHTC